MTVMHADCSPQNVQEMLAMTITTVMTIVTPHFKMQVNVILAMVFSRLF